MSKDKRYNEEDEVFDISNGFYIIPENDEGEEEEPVWIGDPSKKTKLFRKDRGSNKV